jgi:hypothetical protein
VGELKTQHFHENPDLGACASGEMLPSINPSSYLAGLSRVVAIRDRTTLLQPAVHRCLFSSLQNAAWERGVITGIEAR